MSFSIPFLPIPKWLIPITIPDPRFSLVLFPLPLVILIPSRCRSCTANSSIHRFIYSLLDAVPPIHAESSHVATDKVPSM